MSLAGLSLLPWNYGINVVNLKQFKIILQAIRPEGWREERKSNRDKKKSGWTEYKRLLCTLSFFHHDNSQCSMCSRDFTGASWGIRAASEIMHHYKSWHSMCWAGCDIWAIAETSLAGLRTASEISMHHYKSHHSKCWAGCDIWAAAETSLAGKIDELKPLASNPFELWVMSELLLLLLLDHVWYG